MAEEAATTTDTPAGPGGTDKSFTQAELDQIVKDRLTRERGKFADYDDLKQAAARLKEIEDASKTDLEKLTGERDSLKSTSDTLAQQNARLKVALKKGFVGERAELADLLQGKDEKEMEEHADRLLKLVGTEPATTPFDGGPRGDGAPTTDMNTFIRSGARKATV